MKKIIIMAVAFMLAFGAFAAVRAEEGGNSGKREKIPSPAEIKNFRDIIKEGNSLFGFRIQQLEKILNPEEIKNFEAIRRLGNALWGMRKQEAKEPVLIRPEAKSCVSTALDAKDASLKTTLTEMNTKTLAAIDARNTCQKAALEKTTAREQMTANKACVETYAKTVREAQKTMKAAKEATWKKYRTDLKACSVLQRTGENSSSGEIEVEDGENSI